MTHQVHVLPNGPHWCLRVGLLKSFLGWQTAKAAGLKVDTSKWNCLDTLTRAQAESFALVLEKWITKNTPARKLGESKAKVRERALDEIREKYQEAMNEQV